MDTKTLFHCIIHSCHGCYLPLSKLYFDLPADLILGGVQVCNHLVERKGNCIRAKAAEGSLPIDTRGDCVSLDRSGL